MSLIKSSYILMSVIFDIIPLVLTGLSLLEGLEGSGNKESGKHILKQCEELLKNLKPHQVKLLKKFIKELSKCKCQATDITRKKKDKDLIQED
jgi:hypothetical protein